MTDTDAHEIPRHMLAQAHRLVLPSSVRSIWHYTCAGGQSPEENTQWAMTPEVWKPLAAKMRPFDRVEIVSDDLNFFVEFLVVRSDPTYGVVLKPLLGVKLDGVGARDTVARDKTGMRAEYKGPHLKWCVLRGEDVLQDRLQTEQAALQWIATQTQAHQKRSA